MRVLIFALCNQCPHHAIELELIEEHMAKGDEVDYLRCGGGLEACLFKTFPAVTAMDCKCCQAAFDGGLTLLDYKPNIVTFPNISVKYQPIPVFKNVQELRDYEVHGIKYGLGVASELVWYLKNENFDTVKYSKAITLRIQLSMRIFAYTMLMLKTYKPDRVYLFNGRISAFSAVILACQKKGVDYCTHELSQDRRKYTLSYNSLPHHVESFTKRCLEYYEQVTPEYALKKATENFVRRRSGNLLCIPSYTTAQEQEKLPPHFDVTKKNIIFYNNSASEYSSLNLGSVLFGCYSSELDAVIQIASDCLKYEDRHIYFRVHPNIGNTDSSQYEEIVRTLSPYTNITIIPPESTVNSYVLMEKAYIVLTNMSTMGAEAIFWGKPTIVFGYARYKYLGGIVCPNSHEETMHYILNPPRVDRSGIIKYGLYCQEGGISYKNYVATGRNSGFYKGVEITETFYNAPVRELLWGIHEQVMANREQK